MAHVFLKKEILCPLCSVIFTDPVLLHCGHTFCSDCIKTYISNHGQSGVYCCPECKQASKSKAPLTINIALQNIAHSWKLVENRYHLGEASCTYCLEYFSPAVKVCLHCESSLCESHLQVHSKTSEHLLTNVASSVRNRICSIHGEILKFFCTDDKTLICMACFLSGDHHRHGVELLEVTSRHKREQLQEMAGLIQTELRHLKKRTADLRGIIKVSEEQAEMVKDGVKTLCSTLLTHIRKVLRDLESDISQHEHEVFRELLYEISSMEKEEKRLSQKMKKIVDICNQDDPLLILHDETPYKKQKTELQGVRPFLHEGFNKILVSLKIKRSFEKVVKLVQTSLSAQYPDLKHNANILLDVTTASSYLRVSSDLRTVTYTTTKSEHGGKPGQFKTSHVLSESSFLSGKHYWEVKGGKNGIKSFGVAYPSMEKDGPEGFIGYNKKSWGLTWSNGYIAACTNSRSWQIVSEGSTISSVIVYLDYDKGQLSFYRSHPRVEHLYTFTTNFTEPVHAIFYVVNSWIKIIP
ncbi:tripartite motif-containing protein 75-like [Dendropsophus ebraccatus]|uniref:tripartite motif-containing protein 75-like n=1 Tax=Dendropsophus ebraccatus TaxID=150705 RepID=UPI003831A8CB